MQAKFVLSSLTALYLVFGSLASTVKVEVKECCGGDFRFLRVEEARCSAMPVNIRWPGHQREKDQTEIGTFARFDFKRPVEVRVTPDRIFREVRVRPLSRGIKAAQDGKQICFSIKEPGAYSVELDGIHQNLMVFADRPADYSGIDRNAANVRYFGPGEHDVGLIALKTGDTLFIDEGAVVYGRIKARDAHHIRICGRGILDMSRIHGDPVQISQEQAAELKRKGWAVTNITRYDAVRLEFCDDVKVDGITIRDSLIYAIRPICCRGFEVSNVKIVGSWRYNSDGIDMHNCRNVRIRDCFIRTYDDSICVKGFDYILPESEMLHDGIMHDIFEDVLVERCTIWNDWGRALEIGAETRGREIRNVTFRDCDVLECHSVVADVQNCDQAHVHHITYENIRVETSAAKMKTAYAEHATAFDPRATEPSARLTGAIIHYIPEYSKAGADNRGRVSDILFKDFFVTGPDNMPSGFLHGFDAQHRVERVRFEGIHLNGKDVTERFVSRLSRNEFATDKP